MNLELLLVGCFAWYALVMTIRKQKQDLWAMRYEFYKRAKAIWGSRGIFRYIKHLAAMTKEKHLFKDPKEADTYIEELINEIKTKFPFAFIDIDGGFHRSFLPELEEARYLFGNYIADYLEGLSPYGMQQSYEDLEEAWKMNGFVTNFTKRFDKYLKI